jgi:hypothetical protein
MGVRKQLGVTVLTAWMGGGKVEHPAQPGVYGTLGTGAAANVPGAG